MSEKNPKNHTDHMWQTHMQMLTKMKRNIEISETIDKVLHQYYVVERGQKVPNWRYIKDTDWWVEYLTNLGIDPRNP